jgi:cell division protein FtsW
MDRNPTPVNYAVGDRTLWLGPLFMAMFGLVMVYSATSFMATEKTGSNWFYLARQGSLVMVGLGALLFGMVIQIDHYRKMITPLIWLMIVVMFLLIQYGPWVRYTKRFVGIFGLTFQSTEYARIIVVAYIAKILSDDAGLSLRMNRELVKKLIPVMLILVLAFLQRDVSGPLMIGALAAFMLYLAGLDKRQFWGVTGGFALVGSVASYLVPYVRGRVYRFGQFLMDFEEGAKNAANWQSFQALLGLGQGGIMGVGVSHGKQKYLFLPEIHTDFIYANVAEELGLWGATAVLFVFVLLYFRSINVIKVQSDRFHFLLGSGLIASLLMFAFVHIAVNVALIPVTGLSLPFISNGGASLITSLWSMGVIWQMSTRVRRND